MTNIKVTEKETSFWLKPNDAAVLHWIKMGVARAVGLSPSNVTISWEDGYAPFDKPLFTAHVKLGIVGAYPHLMCFSFPFMEDISLMTADKQWVKEKAIDRYFEEIRDWAQCILKDIPIFWY